MSLRKIPVRDLTCSMRAMTKVDLTMFVIKNCIIQGYSNDQDMPGIRASMAKSEVGSNSVQNDSKWALIVISNKENLR